MKLPEPTKPRFLDTVAEENGIAVVILDEEGREVFAANNNSICALLYSSPQTRGDCAEYCGRAFERTASSDKPVVYECHAGLACQAVPVEDRGRRFVAITGRTFVRSNRYREATEKAISGEWSTFPPTEFFGNILFSGSSEPMKKAVAKLERFAPQPAAPSPEPAREEVDTKTPDEKQTPPVLETVSEQPQAGKITELIDKFNREAANRPPVSAPLEQQLKKRPEEVSAMRSLMGRLMRMDHQVAAAAILEHLSRFHGAASAAWLESRDGVFASISGIGELEAKQVRADLRGLMHVGESDAEHVLELNPKRSAGKHGVLGALLFFPVVIGGEIKSAVGIHSSGEDDLDRAAVTRFVKTVGPKMEILRLQEQVSARDSLARNLKEFNESLRKIDSADFWNQITRVSAGLLGAERASILIRDEETGALSARAFIGAPVDIMRVDDIGSRVAKRAGDGGEPLVVEDIDRSRYSRAPEERRYRTGSFLSFPISIGDRNLAVLNFTDRVGGPAFGESDVELLKAIAPQLAVALDRKALKIKAGELEKRSITDSLTGLMNRGYIEERLVEEMNRASRHRFPMCLLMIDVDNFKQYNDTYGHPAGDTALVMVAGALKDTLRAADVAARYGGEEFAVLLPQTAAEEGKAIAERLRQRIERTEFPKRRVTISIGLAAYSNEFAEPKDWITAADMALYEAKGLGRNIVQNYEDLGRSFKEKIH
ncbi:MAG: diguanylate cyclase [Acidobacteria bacterium]|nr:diguanylate cyclase [Acidobacteriota bacterium]